MASDLLLMTTMRASNLTILAVVLIGITGCDSNGTTSTVYPSSAAVLSGLSPSPTPTASASATPTPSPTPSPYVFSGGSGTPGSPYSLRTPTDVQHIKDFLDAQYTLDENIDMSGISLSPIGSLSSPFTGTIYGNQRSISGITMGANDGSTVALFGALAGEIIQLNLTNITMSSNGYVAGIAGTLTGVIWSCNVIGTFTSSMGGNGYNTGVSNGLILAAPPGELCQVNQKALPFIYGSNCLPLSSGATIYNSASGGTFNGNRFNNPINFGPDLPPIQICQNGTCTNSLIRNCVGPSAYSLNCTAP